jgi:hypothetical protein
MPADDLILNVRQIGQYPPLGAVPPGFAVVLQNGIGGPYYSASAAALVGTALAEAGPLMVGTGDAPGDAFGGQIFTDNLVVNLGATHNWNCYFSLSTDDFVVSNPGPSASFGFAASGVYVWNAGPSQAAGAEAGQAQLMSLTSAGYLTVEDQVLLARDPAAPLESATAQWVEAVVAATFADTVHSFNGRQGDVRLWPDDLRCAGGAPIFSPRFEGEPRAETPMPWSHSNRLATTAFVQRNSVEYITHLLEDHPFVFTFNGRSGDVILTDADLETVGADFAPLASPAFTGTPTAPTPLPSDNSTTLATTAFVFTALNQFYNNQIYGAFAPLDSPAFTGYATALTAPPGTSTAQLATTAFVMGAVADSVAGVATFNGRSGIVELTLLDITAAGGAGLASPAFTGAPTAPTAAAGTNNNQLATTAWVLNELGGANLGVVSFNGRGGAVVLNTSDIVNAGGAALASPNFSGVPTAPTAADGDNSDTLATTAYVQSAIANDISGVVSFNGRTGTITLTQADISAAGGAILASPIFSGMPTAPTAAPATNSNQLATCAFVQAAIAAVAAVTSFNGRTGPVSLTTLDITNAGGAVLASPAFTGTPTAPTASSGTNTTQLATTAYVMARAGLYLALTGGTLTGALTVTGANLAVTNAGNAFTLWTVPGVRAWWAGTTGSGSFGIIDQSAAATRFAIDASGNVSCGGAFNSAVQCAAPSGVFSSSVNIGNGLVLSNNGGYLYSASGFMSPLIRAMQQPGFYNSGNIPVIGNIANMAIITSASSPTGLAFTATDAANTVAYWIWVDAGSDMRIKKNIVDTSVDALAVLLTLPIRAFDFNPAALDAIRPTGGQRSPSYHVPIGVVAQEAEPIIPEMVFTTQQPEGHSTSFPDDMRGIHLPSAIPYLIRAIQQLAERVMMLEARLAT